MGRWAAIAIGVTISVYLLLGVAEAFAQAGACRNKDSDPNNPNCGAPSAPAPPLPPTPSKGPAPRCTGERAQICTSCMQRCAFDPTRVGGSCNDGRCDYNSPNYRHDQRSDVYINCIVGCSPESDVQGPPVHRPSDGDPPEKLPTKDCFCPMSPNPSATNPGYFQGGRPGS
jgi:hypothetical protein